MLAGPDGGRDPSAVGVAPVYPPVPSLKEARMAGKGQLAALLLGGYLLGRTKKMRLALTLAAAVGGSRMAGNAGGKSVLGQINGLVASNPQAKALVDQVTTTLAQSAKTAAIAGATRGVQNINTRLQTRLGQPVQGAASAAGGAASAAGGAASTAAQGAGDTAKGAGNAAKDPVSGVVPGAKRKSSSQEERPADEEQPVDDEQPEEDEQEPAEDEQSEEEQPAA